MSDSKQRFNNRVEDYVKYRPGYPLEIIGFLQQNYKLAPGNLIADIGAGTGISAALFLRAGYHVMAIEPNREMRDKSVELLGHISSFQTVDGSAEHTGLQTGSVDTIVCGQAFHWFDIPKAKIEFQRILKAEGLVILIWNERKTESAFEKDYDALIIKHAIDYVKVDHRNISNENISAFYSPNPVHLETFQNSQVFDYSGLEGRLLSSSYMPAKNNNGYHNMIADLRYLFDQYQVNGTITIHYDTKVYIGKLK